MRSVKELQDELDDRIISSNEYYAKLLRDAEKKYTDKTRSLKEQRDDRFKELKDKYHKEISARQQKEQKMGTDFLAVPLNKLSLKQREIVKASKECKAAQDALLAKEREKKKQREENPVAFAAAAKERIEDNVKQEEVKKEEKRAEVFAGIADLFGFEEEQQEEEQKHDLNDSEEEELARINEEIARKKAAREAHARAEAAREAKAREVMKQHQEDEEPDMYEEFKRTPLTYTQQLPPAVIPALKPAKRPVKKVGQRSAYSLPVDD